MINIAVNLYKKAFVIILIMGLILFFFERVYNYGYDRAEQKWLAKWSQRDAYDAIQSQKRQLLSQENERRINQRLLKVMQDEKQTRNRIENDALMVDDAAKRMQLAISHGKRMSEHISTNIVNKCSTGYRSRAVLTELLSKSIEENRRLAKQADKSRLAGLTCEEFYKTVTKTN
ncbi:DUF2514 family protein [Klebsiella aerogenes]|uniref:DUF2514 family protein n=1 Tax=Klebsiella aerogenes TaxID=548 RepID=UPI003D321695